MDMVDKLMIKKKVGNIKSTVSEKKEDVGGKINEMKEFAKDTKDDMKDEVGKWRKLAPKLFV
jgi:HSP20 family protein